MSKKAKKQPYISSPSRKDHGLRPIVFLLMGLCIVGLGVFIYWGVLNGTFIWDDDFLVKNNTMIQSWSNSKDIFTHDVSGGKGEEYKAYRPFQVVTYLIDYGFWGKNPRVFCRF